MIQVSEAVLARRFTAFGATFMALYALGLALAPSEGYLRFQSNVIYNVAGLAALGFAYLRSRTEEGPEKAGWLLLCLFLLSWQAGDWAYSFYDFAYHSTPPTPGIVDLVYLGGYLSCFGAIALLTFRPGTTSHIHWGLDVVLVTLVAGCFQWELIMRPLTANSGLSTFSLSVALSYPFLDIALVAAILGGIFRSAGRLPPRSACLLLAVLFLVVTDSSYAYGIETGFETVGSPLELGWLASYFLMGLAATMPREVQSITRYSSLSVLWLSTPYLLAMPLPFMVAVRALQANDFDSLAIGGALVLILAFIKQIMTLLAAARAIDVERQKAQTDALTGLLNHGGVVEEAERLLATDPPSAFCIALIDFDNLKSINDTFGHAAGDSALRTLARELKSLEGSIGRYGGDEFLVLRRTSWSESAQQLGNDVAEAIKRAEWAANLDGFGVGASFGVATFPLDAPDFGSLLQVADAAMYLQKRSKGRDASEIPNDLRKSA